MKNFILATMSFIATVLILSQVALAESNDWDPKHTQSASGDEPALNTQAGRKGAFPEGYAPDSAEENPSNCKTCPSFKAQVNNLNDKHTVPSQMEQSPVTSGSSEGGSNGAKGTK